MCVTNGASNKRCSFEGYVKGGVCITHGTQVQRQKEMQLHHEKETMQLRGMDQRSRKGEGEFVSPMAQKWRQNDCTMEPEEGKEFVLHMAQR